MANEIAEAGGLQVHYQQLGNLKMAYEDEGQGEAVVLVHGFCGSRAYWRAIAPVLARRYRVLVPDLRGHGATGRGAGLDGAPVTADGPERADTETGNAPAISMEALAADLVALLDRLGIAQASLFGHSLGGYAALAFAESHPERLRRFGLVHSTPLPDTAAGKDKRRQDQRLIAEQGLDAFLRQLVPNLIAPDQAKARPELIHTLTEIGRSTDPGSAIRLLEGMRTRPDRSAVLSGLQAPVLLLAGEQDRLIPPERAFPVRSSGIRTHSLPNAGHMSMLECPEAAVAALLEFLQEAGADS